MTSQEILQHYWGHSHFRPVQEDIINAVLDGKDVLALLPTGGGKSVCFQVPALAKEGLCLVVSPLIALIKDQVEQLTRRDIPALAIYAGMSFTEVKKTLQNAAYGNYKFLYVSPERLETRLFLEFLPSMPINLIAVDEAHCISQWGYDFRPPYMRIAAIRELLPRIPVLALTASATKVVQDDICEKLAFGKGHASFRQSFERSNLSYSVFNAPSKQVKLLEILKNVPGSAIVYCKSRRHTKEIADLLLLHTISADYYHAGLDNEARSRKQEAWINDRIRVIVSTNAFGMGIDKPDVRTVVHYDVPDCIENYYQEAGRAGRDGKRAYAVLLYSNKEITALQSQADTRFPPPEKIKSIYIDLMNHLQVAAGAGEGRNIDFDMAVFAAAFKQDILTTTYVIKALEQEDVLSYTEMFFKPSTVLFVTDRHSLEAFEKQQPELEPLIKGLLRSYEAIFDHPAIVYETVLARFLKTGVETVKKGLSELHRYGIILYSPQKDTPQLVLLKNRMYADSFYIDTTNYLERKKVFEERVAAMIDYIKQTTTCRSRSIAAYFDAPVSKDCGICDNCINRQDKGIGREEFESIAAAVQQLVKASPQTADMLLEKLQEFNKEKTWKVIRYLEAEQKIKTGRDGYITV